MKNRSLKTALLIAAFSVLSVSPWLNSSSLAGDWLHWRGPQQTGSSTETNLPDKFSLDPKDPKSNLLWTVPYGCRSTPLIMGGKVYIINDDPAPPGVATGGEHEGERVMALDLATGKVLWEHRFNVFLCDMVASRVGWTNLAADPTTHRIYAHGTQGYLMCLDADTGKVVWQRSLTEEFGRVTGYGGRSVSPTVDGDLVIIGMINSSWGDQGRGANRYAAFDKNTGEVVWWSEPATAMKGTYYSNPIIAEVNGQRLLITGLADGELAALQVRTGVKVWGYQFSGNVINASPVMEGTLIYCTQSEENLDVGEKGRVICVDAAKITDGQPKLVWEEIGVMAGLASPLLHGDRLYVPDNGGTLFCFDAKKGGILWKKKYGRAARGAPVWADGKIYVAEVNAHFHVLKDEGQRCKELHDQHFPSAVSGIVEINGTPAVAVGKLVFGTRDDLYCLANKNPSARNNTEDPNIPNVTFTFGAARTRLAGVAIAAGPPAHAQIVPADVSLAPGASVAFKLRLFDKDGNFIKESPAAWSLPTPPKTPAGLQPPPLKAEIKDGVLTVAKDLPGQQGYVDASADGLTARARVRVAPQLPYKNNFEKVPVGATPGGWINCQGKFVIVELNGKRVLKKLANDARPPLAKVSCYIGMPALKDYVIQADVSGTFKNNNLPDVGIVNCRYTLSLVGNQQVLRLSSWEAQKRIDKKMPFAWKAGEWFRCKLEVAPHGDSAVVRGKVWPRDKPEPAAWTIEVTDPRPNLDGSPGLFGNAAGILSELEGAAAVGAEAYYDNLSVVPR
jgi:outer membrane protein assembly factor BamB